MTLTSDPLTLKLVHGVLVSQGPFLPSLVFVGLFVFPLGGGTGQTDRRTNGQTDGQDQHMMGPPSRKDGPIISKQIQLTSITRTNTEFTVTCPSTYLNLHLLTVATPYRTTGSKILPNIYFTTSLIIN